MRKMRKAVTLILGAIFSVSLFMAVFTQLDYSDAAHDYTKAALIAGQPVSTGYSPAMPQEPEAVHLSENCDIPDEPSENRIRDSFAQSLFSIDLNALKSENPDVFGWILVPDTNISYPLVQSDDNAYYLDHTWNGGESHAGSIFLEAQNDTAMGDHNTILYGHNLKNGTMFTQLHKFKQQSFWEDHRHIYIVTSDGIRRYEIFAAYEAPVDGPTYWLDVNTKELKQQLLDEALSLTVLDTGITPATEEKILTLSTCTGYTYARRWVVKARFEGLVIPDQEKAPVKHLLVLAE